MLSSFVVLAAGLVYAVAAVHTRQFNDFASFPDASFTVLDNHVVHETVRIEYNWTGSGTNRSAAIADGLFVVENNVFSGIAYHRGTLFLTVPRWRRGVPSTLNTASQDAAGNLVLTPFPSWEWQTKLHSVQSMFVDQKSGIMWVIDTGRTGFFNVNKTLHPPVDRHASIHLFNLTDPAIPRIDYFQFPDDMLPVNTSFLNDIKVDVERGYAYMPDNNNAGLGAIVFWDRATRACFRFQDPNSTYSEGSEIVINGIAYPQFDSPVDGVALSHDGEYFYYSAVTGVKLHRIPTAMLRPNKTITFAQRQAAVDVVLNKGSPGGGMSMVPRVGSTAATDQDLILYGANNYDAVYMAQTAANERVVVEHNAVDMVWVDALTSVGGAYGGVDADEFVTYFVTNRLQLFLTNTMVWNGTAGPNMRVFRLHAKGVRGHAARHRPYTTGIIVGSVLAGACILLIAAGVVLRRFRSRQAEGAYEPLGDQP